MTTKAFTLIEISIVLVIIGLLAGGVLAGREIISQAEVRGTLAQIEKYNSATNTFRGKFNALPGDMGVTTAQQFGFALDSGQGGGCDGAQGHRDNNGLIDGNASPNTLIEFKGETGLFWMDLSSPFAGKLIDGQFPSAGGLLYCNASSAIGLTAVGEYIPAAKIGRGNYVYVYETSGANWFGVSAVTASSSGTLLSSANISVAQASAMDSKVDDGLPLSGNVQANYINNNTTTAQTSPNTSTSGGNATSCYDTTTSTYSTAFNSGTGGNCALSFKLE